jgi:RNA polymerase primary sigma factor
MNNRKQIEPMRQLKITPSVTARTQTVEEYLRDLGKLEMVTPEEETELAVRIQAGDDAAFKRLVEANLRFVVSVAKQYQNRGLDLPDLINEGNIGLMKAALKFDPTRGFKFVSYAVWWIRQQILQSLSDKGRLVRLPLNQVGILNKIGRARTEFLQENEREPTDEELSALLDISPEKLGESVMSDIRGLSLDFPLGEDQTESLIDILPNNDSPSADKELENESLRKDIDTVMDVLNERERRVLVLCFGLGCPPMTLEEIGENLDLTRERVRQLKMKAIHKLSSPKVRSRLAQYL